MHLRRELALVYRKDRTLTHAANAFLETALGAAPQAAYAPARPMRIVRPAAEKLTQSGGKG
jgi:hypothetical protein